MTFKIISSRLPFEVACFETEHEKSKHWQYKAKGVANTNPDSTKRLTST